MINSRDVLRAIAAGVLAWAAAGALLVVLGLLVGCGAPSVAFDSANATVEHPVSTEYGVAVSGTVLLAEQYEVGLEVGVLIVDGSPKCWAISLAGVRYVHPDVRQREECVDWLDHMRKTPEVANGGIDWGVVARVTGQLLGGVLGGMLGV